ncbi:hypothetical protein DAEQUDRAFT_354264 [Daedalea quercina L-15889]|uniref:NudC domain-containing protein 1 n=1 Tax=Daedalea quercina L-15889 TaxID=1314783 RepID=A0A165TQD5_9APHY|nr:hypothetical protein DAEQUDRAFT_354264 [Daedalea quercina L-15889]
MANFKPNRALLNPRFEGYKLSPILQEQAVSHYGLQYRPSQMNVSGRSHVTFQEVQSRISHNHLALCTQDGSAAYVDEELRVVSVKLSEAALEPGLRLLYELPKPIISPEADPPQREYPSVGFLDASSIFVSDGHGTLYALTIPNAGPAELVGTFELAIPATYGSSRSAVPFRIHHVAQTAPDTAIVVLSSKHYPSAAATSSDVTSSGTRPHPKSPEFDVWAARFTLPMTPVPDQTRALDILWHRRGDDVPIYTFYDALQRAFMLVGASYRTIDAGPDPLYTPTPDELAPIPRANENLDGTPAPPSNALQKPPPYSWTQTPDSVTIAIPLPSSTPTDAIKIAFSLRTLTVLVRDAGSGDTPSAVPLPRYDMKPLWDHVQPSTSMWTFDRAAERRYGVLTLHLDKAHEGTRWPQVFAAAGATAPALGSKTGVADEEEEVPETLDPSELYAIREALEKYTAALQSGEDASGLGLGRGVPSLAKDEMDDELDVSVGRSACVTWVGADGTAAVGYDDDAPLEVLSTPFPGTDGADADRPSLVVKNGIDGVVYELGAANSAEQRPEWKHTSTYSALAFVLASKRDTRFTFHVSSRAVLAFESGSSDLGGNVYIYRGAPAKEKWAKQAVLKAGGGTAGALLGIGLVTAGPNAEPVILCLCEGELILLRNVL